MNNWEIKIIDWVRTNPLHGYDPYDILSLNNKTRSLMRPFKDLSIMNKFLFIVIDKLNNYLPVFTRKLLEVKKKKHPTYIGFLLHAELNLKQELRDENRINLLKTELEKSRIINYANHCWGTPFAWKSGLTDYPIGTPFTVVTAWIGEAYLTSYRIFQQESDLDILNSIADFFISDLPRIETSNSICFSYSPIVKTDINNSNLMVAGYLAQLGELTNNTKYIELAKKSVEFSISTQLNSGLIPYYGNTGCKTNDSYHSSYEIKSLTQVYKVTKDESLKQSIFNYLTYYIENYIANDCAITKYPKKEFPVDGTAIADGLIMFYELQFIFPELNLENYIVNLKNLINQEWVKKDGSVKYKKLRKSKFIEITYTRWIMGWFALAASYSLKK